MRTTRETGLFGAAALYLAADALSNLIPLLLLPVMTRFLSPRDYGIVAMFSILQLFVQPLIAVSLKDAITARFFDRTARDLARFVTTCLAIVGGSALLVAVAMLPMRQLLADVTHVPAGWLVVAVLAAAAQCTIFLHLAIWQARGMTISFGVFQVAMTLTNVGLSVLLVVGLGWAWEGRLIGYIGALILFAAVAVVMLWRASDLGWPPRADHAREALAFALPLVPHGLGVAALAVADRVLITNMLDVEQTGLYTAALQISMVLGLLGLAFNRAYRPWLFAGLAQDAPGFRERAVRGSYLHAAFLAAAAAAIAVAAPVVVRIVLGKDFQAGGTLIPYLAAGYAFAGMYYIVANYIVFSRQTSRLSAATLASAAVNILGGIVLIRQNGALGAAQAFMASQAILFLITWWLAHRVHPMPWWGALSGWWRAA